MLPLPPYRRSKTPIDRAVICLALLASDTNVANGVAPGRRCIQFQNLTAMRPSVCCHARVNYPPLQPIPRSTLDAILTQAARSRPLLPYIHLAPPGRHLPVESDELRLGSGPRENNARPALDPLFRSTGLCCGPRAIGSILAATLGDGAAGLALRQCGGITVVQDPSDAANPEMPTTALTVWKPTTLLAMRTCRALKRSLKFIANHGSMFNLNRSSREVRLPSRTHVKLALVSERKC